MRVFVRHGFGIASLRVTITFFVINVACFFGKRFFHQQNIKYLTTGVAPHQLAASVIFEGRGVSVCGAGEYDPRLDVYHHQQDRHHRRAGRGGSLVCYLALQPGVQSACQKQLLRGDDITPEGKIFLKK